LKCIWVKIISKMICDFALTRTFTNFMSNGKSFNAFLTFFMRFPLIWFLNSISPLVRTSFSTNSDDTPTNDFPLLDWFYFFLDFQTKMNIQKKYVSLFLLKIKIGEWIKETRFIQFRCFRFINDVFEWIIMRNFLFRILIFT